MKTRSLALVTLLATSTALAGDRKLPELPPPERPTIPVLPLSALDHCPREQLEFTLASIASAIEIGAPVYNSGDHVGCYRLYLGTATDLVAKLPDCPGVRSALSAGIKRATSIQDYTAEAWAMRDAFDGLIRVVALKAASEAPPPHPTEWH